MSLNSLPLFAWTQPRTVLLFPLAKRVSKVRHTTAMLLQKRGEDADLYWKQVISANRKSLARVGFSDAETEKELRAFFDAVQSELVRAKAIRERNENGAA